VTPACREVLDALDAGGAPLPERLAEHVRGCAGCQSVVKGYQALSKSRGPLWSPLQPGVREAARKALVAQPRAKASWGAPAALLVAELAVACAGVLALGRNGWVHNRSPPGVIAAVAGALLLAMAASAWLAMGRLRGAALVGWLGGLWLLAVGGVLLGASGVGPATSSSGCLGMELLLAVLPVGVAIMLLTRTAYQPGRTFFAALSAGGAGLFALELHCPDGTLQHLVGFHLLPWLAAAGVAVLVRSRLASRSFAP
jgi:hypothetical protein